MPPPLPHPRRTTLPSLPPLLLFVAASFTVIPHPVAALPNYHRRHIKGVRGSEEDRREPLDASSGLSTSYSPAYLHTTVPTRERLTSLRGGGGKGSRVASDLISDSTDPVPTSSSLTSSSPPLPPTNVQHENTLECAATSNGSSEERATLRWFDVSCVRELAGKPMKVLLANVTGEARRGRMMAIMGPSGAGKSTLLKALAGRLPSAKGLRLTGHMETSLRDPNTGNKNCIDAVFIPQEDTFYSQMTVWETLMFNARLRLPKEMPMVEKKRRAMNLMTKLGLAKSHDTIVGNEKQRGISGGEKKRLSIACELLSGGEIIFADEPTSGLDSFQAETVMQSLRRLADEGHTVIVVIHQPSGALFGMIDDLALLSEGRLLYMGPARQAERILSKTNGAHSSESKKANISPPEYLLRLASVDYRSKETEQASKESISAMASAQARVSRTKAETAYTRVMERYQQQRKAGEGEKTHVIPQIKKKHRTGPVASLREQFTLLFSRAFKEATRNKLVLFIKIVQQVTTAIVYGGIFSLSSSASSIQDRFGLLSLVAIGALNLNLAGTIRSFPKEKAIVDYERSKNVYGVVAYFLSKLAAETPINVALSLLFGGLIYPMVGLQRDLGKFVNFLAITTLHSFASSALGMSIGASTPSQDAALALMPPVIILQAVFNGMNIAEENTPKLLRWIPKVSLVRWCFEGLAINEFSGLTFERPPRRGVPIQRARKNRGIDVVTGSEALERVSITETDVSRSMLAEGSLLALFYIQSIASLASSRKKFAEMENIIFVDNGSVSLKLPVDCAD